jgi:tetratricopeptide (TPR) repeat protein
LNSSHLKASLITLALCFGITQLNAAQRVAPPPPKPDPGTSPGKEQAPDYSQEALVIEQIKMSYRFEKDGTGVREQNFRARVQSDAAVEQFGQIVLPYSSDNEQLDIEFVRVYKPDGTVINSTSSDVQDLSAPIAREAPVYTDLRQKHITVRGLRPGDTLAYHAIWRITTPLAANHFWLEHDFFEPGTLIVLDEQLEVNIPRDSKVKLKTAAGKDPAVRDQEDRRVYSWKYASLKRKKDDDDDDDKKKRIEDDDPKPPQVQITTFQSWTEVGNWYHMLEKERTTPDEKIRIKAEEIVRGRTTEREKIQALYEYVAKNFRYVSLSLGQGRYQPHAAAEVFANEYGDCKDKHTLLSAMLNATGLHAYPALMNSRRKIDAEVPSPGQFDHVITAVPLANETLWMDTTAEVAPFRLLSPQLRDKKALVIPIDAPAQLETTPTEPPFMSSELIEITGEVNELGKLSGHTHMKLRGDSEMIFRMLFRRTPKSEWKRVGYYLSAVTGSRGTQVNEIKPTDPAALEQPFEVDYDFNDDNFLDWSSKKEKVGLPFPTVHLPLIGADRQESSRPIELGAPLDIVYRLKLTLPAKYKARAPLPLKVSRDYAEYSSNYKLEGNTITAERKYRLNRHELPSDRTQDYIAFAAAARADESQTLALETEIAGTPSIPETVKVDDLIQAADAAAKNRNYPVVEQLLKRVLEKEPKHKDARRQLSWALFAQQKYDEAIAALQEQTKINPFDNYAYNMLGRIYWAKDNYSEAETAFRKQLEITPLDSQAHTNLGQMLVQWRKFKEAIPELESAISLSPEEEMLYVSLGQAYLNVGEAAKGIQALDKAVKLAPGPLVWNDVAYNMALNKVQLDKAQQYAESAVTTVATELRNVELSQLTIKDIGLVASLAAYWDTLGWVYYQKGDTQTAEKYVRAAWALQQHSEVGCHLGEILEKSGKKDEAAEAYTLAATATRLVPEAMEGLIRLVGKTKSDELMKFPPDASRNLRTIKFSSGLKNLKAREAQFYVVLVPGPTRNAEVSEVKFIQGDEKLVPISAGLKTANFNFTFPDATNTKIVRRGTLFCNAANGECSFIMISPDAISSVE